jgi:subtilisin family serine protease
MTRSVGLLAIFHFAVSVWGESAEIDPQIFAASGPGERVSFLVVMREQADLSGAAAIRDPVERRRFVFEALREVAERTQVPLLDRLRTAGATARPHYLVNFVEVEGDRFLASELADMPEVSGLAANRPARLERAPAVVDLQESSSGRAAPVSASTAGPNLALIGATDLWNRGFTGQGIVVGDADTGFEWDHPALRPHYRGFDGVSVSHDYNWHDAIHDAGVENPCGSNTTAPCDDDGHGTSTSGLALGDDGAENRVGVAPGARLIGCRNMDAGVGTPARYTECFEFLLAPTDRRGNNPRPELGADVVSNSWVCPPSEGCTDPNVLRGVVEAVRSAGMFVVVSAGNGGPDCMSIVTAPSIYASSFTIGATDNSDLSAFFSSRGPVTVDRSNRLKPDICAPGLTVRTTALSGTYNEFFSGTSAAAPHVAGAVALLWSAVPYLRGDVHATEEILRASAVPLVSSQSCAGFPGKTVPNVVFGYGRLDCVAALALALTRPDRIIRAVPHRPAQTHKVAPRLR